MNNCYTGTNVPPTLIVEPCEGIYKNDACVIHESAIPYLELPANSSVKEIINNLVLALLYKDEQIQNQTTIIEELTPKYKVYTALLTQTGTNAPVATVLENTLGGNVTWSYIDIGDYLAQTSGLFAGNVGGFIQDTNVNFSRLQKISNNNVNLSTFDANSVISDGLLTNCLIEIRVYN